MRLLLPFLLFCLLGSSAFAVERGAPVINKSDSPKKSEARLTFSCAPENDLFVALKSYHFPRFNHPEEAIENAPDGSGVLLLADRYPEQTLYLEPAEFELIKKKNLHVYIEYPSALPGLETASTPRTANWERIVVGTDLFGTNLAKMSILAAHECRFRPVIGAPLGDLVLARVAGYDQAVFGLPAKGAFAILFQLPEKNLVVATTKLSDFVTGRFAPAGRWELVWKKVLDLLAPDLALELKIEPVVSAAYSATAKLPDGFESAAFSKAVDWFAHSHLLVHASQKEAFDQALRVGMENTLPPLASAPEGDGSLGIMEGYSSGISIDGEQKPRLPLRADCNAESAMVFALDGGVKNVVLARNLLDFVYFNSGICQGPRADTNHPAFGLIGWGDVAPAWLVANYGDDNAAAMLATMAVGASLHEARWDEPLMRALLANFRTTGKNGFRGDRVDIGPLEANGWKHFYNADTVNYSPHFEALLWACNLWAYQQTHYPPFFNRTEKAIAMMMKAYPGQWRWQDNLERAHMLLCLAWLIRVHDTPEHRDWLNQVTTDLLAYQQPDGSIRERLAKTGGGHYRVPQSNEEYGTSETPLLQKDGDPVTDQLYTTGFALLGLHEAAAATADINLKHAEDKLAEFLCRIQTRSTKFSYLNGTWFRAFDDRQWEAWASSADAGWGAWSLEAGWGQSWTTATLGLRQKKTTLWDLTSDSKVKKYFEKVKGQMGLEE